MANFGDARDGLTYGDAWDILKSRGLIQQHTDEQTLRAALSSGPITFYAGFDPTADSLHIGHLVPGMAMAWLQACGHRAIAVVGGGTAMIGDPSGKTEMRQFMTPEMVATNLRGIAKQLSHFLILDGEKGLIVDNAEWLMSLSYIPFLRDIGRHFSVNRMLTAEGYRQRLERGLNFIELNYQILQAYDFLELFRRYGCTLEVGGDDQWSNILAGADLIRRADQADAHVITQPLLLSSAGQKMGKTAAGAVWLDSNKFSSFDLFQYWLNILDADVGRCLRLFTFLSLERISQLESLQGADIREAKRVLAYEFVKMIHGQSAAEAADTASKAMTAGDASEQLPQHPITELPIKITTVIAESGMAKSRTEARKLIENGGVRIGSDKISDSELQLTEIPPEGLILRVGKKQAVRLFQP